MKICLKSGESFNGSVSGFKEYVGIHERYWVIQNWEIGVVSNISESKISEETILEVKKELEMKIK